MVVASTGVLLLLNYRFYLSLSLFQRTLNVLMTAPKCPLYYDPLAAACIRFNRA